MSFPVTVPSVNAYAGDTLVFPTYSFETDGEPTDLSAWDSWAAQWRPEDDSAEYITLTVVKTNSTFAITATAEQARAMGKSGVWDLQATDGAVIRTFIRGQVIYQMDVTRV